MTILLVILIVLVALVVRIYIFPKRPFEKEEKPSNSEWEYGDIWKEGSAEKTGSRDDVAYVEILRADTGSGYDDSSMIDLVSYLGSRGISATYDSFSLGAEVGAMKTYVLKVESGKEDEAIEYLKEKG